MIAVERLAPSNPHHCDECQALSIAALLFTPLSVVTLPPSGYRVLLCDHHLAQLAQAAQPLTPAEVEALRWARRAALHAEPLGEDDAADRLEAIAVLDRLIATGAPK